jgi:hypothetical protein
LRQLPGSVQSLLETVCFLRLTGRLSGLAKSSFRVAQLGAHFRLPIVRVLVVFFLKILVSGSRGIVKRLSRRIDAVRSAILRELVRHAAQLSGSIGVLLPVVIRHGLQLLLEIAGSTLHVRLLLCLLTRLLLAGCARLESLDFLRGLGLLFPQPLDILARLLDPLL